MNSTQLSSKTVKKQGETDFFIHQDNLRKLENGMKYKAVSENSDLYPALLVATKRQALQLQLQPNDRIGSSKLPGDSQIKYCCKKSYYLGKCLDNLVKLSWTRATNPASTQELKNRLEKTFLKPNIVLQLFRRWKNNLNTCPGISHSGNLI